MKHHQRIGKSISVGIILLFIGVAITLVNMTTKTENQVKLNKMVSDRANKLSPSGIRKFFDLLANMEGVISLGVGEPDFVTPWNVREAGIYALEQGYTSYTSNKGLYRLRLLFIPFF
jgi:hypothetical protein